jgi:tape measure domain-containing protein
MARVVHAVDVVIEGQLDPSLAKAVGMTDAELKRLASAAKTFNSLMGKMQANMPREALAASNAINTALNKVGIKSDEVSRKVGRDFHRIGEEAKKSGEKVVKSLAGAFDRIAEHAAHITGIGGIIGGIGGAIAGEEFLKGAFETRAERGVLQTQLRTLTEAAGRPQLAAGIDTLIRNMEGRETPVRYQPMLETANLLLAAAPERFQSVDQMHKMLGQLADVSRSPESFAMVSSAFTKILAEGKVDAQHLNEMSIDTGFAFRKAMSDALKVTPEQLSEMLKKHKLTGEQQIQGLMKAFDLIIGPGGPAYKHAEAQTEGLRGIQERFLGHWSDFQESFGVQLENFITPLADNVFRLLTPAALTHAFDGLTNFTKSMGTAIGETVARFQSSGIITKLQQIGQTIGKMFGADFSKFFETVYAPGIGKVEQMTKAGREWVDAVSGKWIDNIKSALDMIQGAVSFIKDNFEAIKVTVAGLAVALGVGKAVETGAKIWDFFKNITSMTVNAATVFVNGGLGAGAKGVSPEKAIGTVSGLMGGAGPLVAATLGVVAAKYTEEYTRSHAEARAEIIADEKARSARGGTVEGQYNVAAFPASQAMSDLAAKHREAAEAAAKVASSANSAAPALSSISGAANSAAGSLNTLASKISSFQMPSIPAPAAAPSGYPAAPVTPHQHGGIFSRPHLGLVAERGPEAIIPLAKGLSHGLSGVLGGAMKGGLKGGLGGALSGAMSGLLGDLNVHSSPTIHVGSGADTAVIGSILREHAKSIAEEVLQVIAIKMEQSAVV